MPTVILAMQAVTLGVALIILAHVITLGERLDDFQIETRKMIP